MKKFFTLGAMALAAVAMNAQSLKVLPGTADMGYTGLAISQNHLWVSGCGNYNTFGFIWDLTTGQTWTYEAEDTELRCISNTGVASGYNGFDPSPAVTFTAGQEGPVDLPAGADASAIGNGMTPDGSLIVGLSYGSDYTSHACYWKDGQYFRLPEPTQDEAGYEVNGTRAEGVSNDGKVILGAVVDNFSTMPAVLWILNEETGQYEFSNITKDLFNATFDTDPENPKYMQISGEAISGNGQWVALTLVADNDENGRMHFGRFNVATGAITVSAPEEGSLLDVDMIPSAITNDGTMLGYTYYSAWSPTRAARQAIVMAAGSDQVQDLSELYCTEEFAALGEGDNSACSVTPDGQFIQGYHSSAEGISSTWVLDLDNGASLGSVAADAAEAPVEVYDIQGRRVNPASLTTGLYIQRHGDKASKIAVK